jgi:hypothetical protein
MFSHGITIDQNVVEIGRNKVVEEGSENIVDKMLEGGGGIARSKRHDQGFEKSVTGTKSRFPFFTFGHVYQVVGVSDVKGSIVTGFGKTVEGFSYQGERISILDCPFLRHR